MELISLGLELRQSKSFELERLCDNIDELVITVNLGDNHFCDISFKGYECYRVMDEGDALLFWKSFNPNKAELFPFYEATDSEFLESYHKQTLGIRKELNLHHYMVLLENHFVEVIGFDEPTIKYE